MGPTLALTLLLCTFAQNRDQPGLVYLESGTWGTPEEAARAGMIPRGDWWFPKAREKDLRKWDKEDARGLDWKDAYRAKTKHYRIETNVPRWRVELELEPFLEALFETYVRVFAEDFGLSGKAAGNKDIRIYDGFQAYSVNEPEGDRPRPRTNPGFIVNGSQLVVFYDETDPGNFYRTVFHEGAHQFFQSLLPGADPPIWLTEALATYFEGCTYSRATRTITPGFVSAERLKGAQGILRREKDLSPEQMFLDVPKERFRGQEYCLAWSFVHYLIHRPEEGAREHFARFVRAMNGSGAKPAAEVFAEATGEDLHALLEGWRAHVLALEVPEEIHWVALHVPKPAPDVDLRPRDLLWSFDGVEVFSAKQFRELWSARATDRSLEVVAVRCEPDYQSPESTRAFVHATIPPGSPLVLAPLGELERNDGLRD